MFILPNIYFAELYSTSNGRVSNWKDCSLVNESNGHHYMTTSGRVITALNKCGLTRNIEDLREYNHNSVDNPTQQ